jgi:RNA polymerase sigma factor for flagellar operon FliA
VLSAAEREALIVRHTRTVKAVAREIRARLPSHVELDDLVGYGTVGLVIATDRFDRARSVPFEAYARSRIRGAILDALRKADWVPRGVRRRSRLIEGARARLTASLGRDPSRSEMARALDLALPEFDRLERTAVVRRIGSLDAPTSGETDASVLSTVASDDDLQRDLEQIEFLGDLAAAVARLPERERLAVSLYYLDENGLKEVGEKLGVSESRACQLRSQGVERLRHKTRHHRA